MKNILLSFVMLHLSCVGMFYYQNKQYVFEKKDTYTVALVPLSINLPANLFAEIDTFYSLFYRDTASGRIIIPPYETKKLLSENYFEKIRTYKISNPSVHTLNDILSKQDFEKLNSALSNPDFLVVPSIFSITSGYSTAGYYKFRVYELSGGKLLYEREFSLSFGGCSEDAKCIYQCAFFLLANSKKEFNDYIHSHINSERITSFKI